MTVPSILSDERHRVILLCAVVITDRAITLPNYQHEANPLVTALGPSLWIILTVTALTCGVILWYHHELWTHRVSRLSVELCTVMYAVIVSVNLYVLHSG